MIKDISIIIVNWNTKELLKNCLDSIVRTVRDVSYEIIVVDNGSRDGSVEMLKSVFPHVRLIENSRNLGFAAANNQGLRVMCGRYALLLNTDTVLQENAVRELFSFMESCPEAAMACGQLLNADGSKQNSIACFPTLVTLLTNTPLLEYLMPEKYPSKRHHYKRPIEVDSGIGACLIVRKKAVDAVGELDERYFFFFEETDWAYAMKKAGWKIFHVPTAFIYHLQGQSIGNDVHSRISFYRSRYLFFQKWYATPYYRLVAGIIFFRLAVNWLFTSAATVITIGLIKRIRNKQAVYSHLIVWHFRPEKGSR
ncbi:MAG: glycosyltransferase family 2 protein [Syntrophaceae bacterium]|nr:glycosyltransferase family 2 protein [Syntrophaceae bacterium]